MRVRVFLRFCLVFFFVLSILPALAQSNRSPYDSVDPFIGTAGGGNTFPGATLPFGMIQWSPDTGQSAWYFSTDKQITGFSLTHLSGAGCPLYGDFAVLPTTGELTASPATNFAPYAVAFDHEHEQAHPGYYEVTLANGVRVELTVTERSGIARFTFPQGTDARVLANARSSANSYPGKDNPPEKLAGFGDRIEIKPDESFSGWSSAGRFCGS